MDADLDLDAATARVREAVRAEQEAAAAQLRQAQVEEAAFIAGAEGEAVTWLRQWHALLARQLESHLAGLNSSNSVRKAEELLENFPRGGEEYTQHLRAHMRLPITAFSEGQGLEMLCYMALQALPRHSRVYSNVHLGGGWHDASELRAVQTAVLKYERQLKEATRLRRLKVEEQERNTETRSEKEEKARLALSFDEIDVDEADSDPGSDAGGDAGGGVASQPSAPNALIQQVLAMGTLGNAAPSSATQAEPASLAPSRSNSQAGPASLAPSRSASQAGPAAKPRSRRPTRQAVMGRAAMTGWFYIDDHKETQGPFSTNKMRAWISKGYLSNARLARPVNSSEDALRPIWAWPELNPGAEVAQSKAKLHWRVARKTLSVAAMQARALRSDEAFNAFNRALQQRYARSPFGFDALLLRHAFVARVHGVRACMACARAWRACMACVRAWRACVHGVRACMACVRAWRACVHGVRACMACVRAWRACVHGVRRGRRPLPPPRLHAHPPGTLTSPSGRAAAGAPRCSRRSCWRWTRRWSTCSRT